MRDSSACSLLLHLGRGSIDAYRLPTAQQLPMFNEVSFELRPVLPTYQADVSIYGLDSSIGMGYEEFGMD